MSAGAYKNSVTVIQTPRLFTDGVDVIQVSDEAFTFGAIQAIVTVNYAPIEAIQLTSSLYFNLEGSIDTAGDDWVVLTTAAGPSSLPVTPAGTDLNGGVAMGDDSILLTDATGFVANTTGFIYEAAAIGNSEWFRIASVDSNTVNLLGSLSYNHLDETPVFQTAGRIYSGFTSGLYGIQRLRVVAYPGAAGPNFVWSARVGFGMGQY